MKLYYIIGVLFFVTLCFSCRKKTDIEVRLFNPLLNENVSQAKLAIVERKGSSGFFGNSECKEIAVATTNENGIALFNSEKLKTDNKYQYFVVIKEAWGIANNYPCGGYNGSNLKKGGTNQIIKSDLSNGALVKLKINNLFTPVLSGDSLSYRIVLLEAMNPETGYIEGGGGVFSNGIDYNSAKTYSSVMYSSEVNSIGGRVSVYIRKKKLGVITQVYDTLKIYPNQLKIIEINW